MGFRAIEWIDDGRAGGAVLRLIDQKALPGAVHHLDCATPAAIAAAISDMTVRGAPAIGVAAAFGMVMAARATQDLAAADAVLRASRPTAVNLFWALDRMKRIWGGGVPGTDLPARLLAEARAIEVEDVEVNRAISRHAMTVVPEDEVTFYHHCNTGALATVDLGTALGIIRTAHESGRKTFAYLDETRPRLQGAMLSSFELMQLGVPHAIVVDGASAHVMRTRKVDMVVVGCDRVVANGDTANKIGTFNLALAAAHNKVPFYVAAPTSTIDLATPTGDGIEIEERAADEVSEIGGIRIAPEGAPVFNPAFDVTPAELITGFITERGIVRPPFRQGLARLFPKPGR